jgi:GNAT superfamily N-acetyltransferase
MSQRFGTMDYVSRDAGPVQVRRAVPADAAELTRLRVVMFVDMGRDPSLLSPDWQRRNEEHFRVRLAAPDEFAAFVVDQPGGSLAAAAVGWLNHHLIGTSNTTGRVGYVANMCTERGFRGRGYGRAALTALLEWMRASGISMVDLHATPDGEPLYRSVGFVEPTDRALTLRLR